MLPSYLPIANIADATLRRVQDAVQQVLRRVCQCPLLDGVLLPSAAFAAATPMVVVHKLGRTPVGFFPVGLTSAARIYRIPQTNEAQMLTLQSDVATTAALWIF